MTFVPDNAAFWLADRAEACCFTGHRSLPADRLDDIRETTRHVVRVLIHAGFRVFLCGGALGFDTLAEKVVLEMKEAEPEIKLLLALPCRDQTKAWMRLPRDMACSALREYQRIKGLADGVCYVNPFYFDGCMRERNRFMIENSSFCVGYYAGTLKSGAGQTWRMAQKEGLKRYNVFDMLPKRGGAEEGSSSQNH